MPATQEPLWWTHRSVMYKENTCTDFYFRELVREKFPDSDFEHGMVKPNLQATLLDNSKYSTDFSRCKTLHPALRDRAIDLFCDLISPAFIRFPDGCPLMPFAEATTFLDKTAGPGWPFSTKYKTKGDVLSSDCDLEAAVGYLLDGGKAFFSVTPKEEIRSLDKLAADNIRTFTSGPIDLNIAGIMGMYHFAECLSDAWRLVPITIGLNMYNAGWDFLVRKLRFDIVGNDAPKWDGHFVPELFDVCGCILKRFCKEECWEYIDCVIANVKDHPAIFGNGLGCWQEGGMPSGAPYTIVFNSLARLYQFVYYAVSVIPGVTLESFKENLDVSVHGDDSLHGSSPLWSELFANDRLNHFYGPEGLNWSTYFVPVQEKPVPPRDMRYLSHITLLRCGRYVPMHEERSKVLASIVLGAKKEVPEEFSGPHPYHLARFWQITNSCWPDTDFWRNLVNIGLAYQKKFESRYRDDLSWVRAKALARSSESLQRWFCDPVS